eukprot:Hpha_TRINITY_DN8465_c0_g1::TRINITY_DN8465_c0_g1_i1::g.34554::m.34554
MDGGDSPSRYSFRKSDAVIDNIQFNLDSGNGQAEYDDVAESEPDSPLGGRDSMRRSSTGSTTSYIQLWKPTGLMVSVRTVTMLLCLACIVATGATVMVLSVMSIDHAIADTKDAGASALDTCFRTGSDSVTHQTELLMNGMAYSSSALVYNFLDDFRVTAEGFLKFLETEPPSRYTDYDYLYSLRKQLYAYQVSHYSRGSAATGVQNALGMAVIVMEQFTEGHDLGVQTVLNDGTDPAKSILGPTLENDGGIRPSALECKCQEEDFWNVTFNAKTSSVGRLAVLIPDGQVRWSSVVGISYVFVGTFIVGTFRDDQGGKGAIWVAVDLRGVGKFLSELAMGENYTRLYTVIARSWIADMLSLNGTGHELDQTGILTGVSHGGSYGITEGTDPITGLQRNLTSPLRDVEATDGVIRGVAEVINSSYEEYLTLQEVVVSGERQFVQAIRILSPQGIDWWLALSVSYEFVLADIDNAQAATRVSIIESDKRVDDSVRKDRRFVYIIIVCVAAALTGISFFFADRIVRPIIRLRHDMKHVSTLNLDAVSTSQKSRLREVMEMQSSFARMIDFLHEYRSYIPANLLQQDVKKVEEVDPPQDGIIALVFTDIEGSTSLWDAHPDGMNIAMDIHNSLMREQLRAHRGYEVKTIGDAFMVAFGEPADAIRFALGVQTALVQAEWPEDLDRPMEGKAGDGGPLWHGLRVRIGAHCGEAKAEENPLTGRTDYRGTTVNKAARVEAKARGGTVCVTSELLAIVAQDLKSLGSPFVHDHGSHVLKGLPGTSPLHLMLPSALSGRLDSVPTRRRSQESRTSGTHPVPLGQGATPRRASFHLGSAPAFSQDAPSRSQTDNLSCATGEMPGQLHGSPSFRSAGESAAGASEILGHTPNDPSLIPPTINMVSVSVIRAKGILAMDQSHTSDPYVEVQIVQAGETLVKTQVLKSTLTPEWNETFMVKVPDGGKILRDGLTVNFTMRDWNRFSQNCVMGWAQISLSANEVASIVAAGGEVAEQTLKLDDRPGTGAVRSKNLGELTVRVLPHATFATTYAQQGRSPGVGAHLAVPGAKTMVRRRGISDRGKPQATGLQLRPGEVTVCIIHNRDAAQSSDGPRVSAACNAVLRAAGELAAQTDGTVEHVAGREVLLTWNCTAGKASSRNHTVSSLRFAALLSKRVQSIRATAGVATGHMLHGNVGTAKQRFRTVAGRPLAAAQAAADFADVLGTFGLLVDVTADRRVADNTTVQGMVRNADRWQEVSDGQLLDVYEIMVARLLSALEGAWAAGDEGGETELCDEIEHRRRFAAAAADPGVLGRLAEEYPQDAVLRRVAREAKCWTDGRRAVRFAQQSLPFVNIAPSNQQGTPAAPPPPPPGVLRATGRFSRESLGDSTLGGTALYTEGAVTGVDSTPRCDGLQPSTAEVPALVPPPGNHIMLPVPAPAAPAPPDANTAPPEGPPAEAPPMPPPMSAGFVPAGYVPAGAVPAGYMPVQAVVPMQPGYTPATLPVRRTLSGISPAGNGPVAPPALTPAPQTPPGAEPPASATTSVAEAPPPPAGAPPPPPQGNTKRGATKQRRASLQTPTDTSTSGSRVAILTVKMEDQEG